MKYPFVIQHSKGEAGFENLAQAVACALVHARQRGECQIRTPAGFLVADFFRHEGQVVYVALPPWREKVAALLR